MLNFTNVKLVLILLILPNLYFVSSFIFQNFRFEKHSFTNKLHGNFDRNKMSLHANSNPNFNSNYSMLIPNEPNDSDVNIKSSIARIPTTPEALNEMMNSPDNLGNVDGIKKAFGLQAKNSNVKPDNRYYKMVEKLAPNELLTKFSNSAPQNVQEAAKSTIMNILGSLPQYALDASLITTNTKLANLMFQMQITGYMFKNAEYRMSFTRSLKGYPKLPSSASISNGNSTIKLTPSTPPLNDQNADSFSLTKRIGDDLSSKDSLSFEGDITVRNSEGISIQLPASQVTDALRKEVEELRSEIMGLRYQKELELRSNLLSYIQALPEPDLAKLTSDMSQEVMDSIQLLVDSLMGKLGLDATSQEVLIQQPMGALAQLCMWQLVVGYKLREFEALDKGVSMD